MMDAKEALASCLRDCGVRPEILEQIVACGCCRSRQLCLLGRERASLLEDLHQAQRRLDLMDLLMDSLKQENKE